MPESPQVTTAAEWQSAATDGFIQTLPSGRVVKVRRTMDMMALLKTGQLPNALAAIVNEVIRDAGKGKTTSLQDVNLEALAEGDNLRDLILFQEDIVVKMLVEPKAETPPRRGKGKHPDGTKVKPDESEEDFQERLEAWSPTPGAISTDWIDDEDKNFLFNMAQGGTRDVERFRAEQGAAVEPVPASTDVESKAKRTPRPRPAK